MRFSSIDKKNLWYRSVLPRSRYPELVQDCKPDIVAATAACEEVRKSRKFAKLLEIILLIGNIMNTGSKNAQSVGFDISYLPKVIYKRIDTMLSIICAFF